MPRLRWIFFAVAALLAFLIAGTILFFELERINELTRAHAERMAQLAERQRIVTEYGEQIDFYSTDEGVAHLGREQYNFVFPGEQIFIIQIASPDTEVK